MLACNSWVWLRGGAQNVGLQFMGVAEGWDSECWLAIHGCGQGVAQNVSSQPN